MWSFALPGGIAGVRRVGCQRAPPPDLELSAPLPRTPLNFAKHMVRSAQCCLYVWARVYDAWAAGRSLAVIHIKGRMMVISVSRM